MNHFQIMTLLTMQAKMNAKVHPRWREQKYNWGRAIMVEGVELMEHIGWKWWKKQAPDYAQARIEMVDIWHFGMSLMMVGDDEDMNDVADYIQSSVAKPTRYIIFDGIEHDLLDANTLHENIELLIGLAAAGKFSVSVFSAIMDDVGMEWEDLYRGYIAKNVLNFFRQDNGYKAGTYIKDWHHEEDNVRLDEIVRTLDAESPTFEATLYNRLVDAYHAVLTAHGRLTEAAAVVGTKK